MSNRYLFFTDVYHLGAPYTKKVSTQASRSIVRLRSSKGQKGPKK